MKNSFPNARRIIRAEHFELTHSYLNHQQIRQSRERIGMLNEAEARRAEKDITRSDAGFIDEAQYEEVHEDEYLSGKKAPLDGYGFTQMDPEKEINTFSYRVVESNTKNYAWPSNRYYTPQEARYGSIYARHNTSSSKGSWHDSTVD